MKIDEHNFILSLQAGKEEALDYVIDQYLPLIKGVVMKMLGSFNNEHNVKACCNDILFSIWHHAEKFKGDAQDFRKWVCVIAKYRAIDVYRIEMKKQDALMPNPELAAAIFQHERSTLEEQQEVEAIIATLKPEDQKIFIMRYLLDFSSEEIARQLQMTKSAVDNRLYNGKKRLKLALGGEAFERSL